MASHTPSYFTNRVYALAGGASGIGLATARQLLALGAKVSIGDYRIPPTLAADLRGHIPAASTADADVDTDAHLLIMPVDVTQRAQVDAWTAATVARFGRLDGAANLAGTIPTDHNIGTVEGASAADDDEWTRVFRVNVDGVRNCLRAQLQYVGRGWVEHAPAAASHPLGQGNPKAEAGSVVVAGSGLSLAGRGGTAAYTSSKHAVLGLARCVAREVGGRGTRVNCLCPGFTATPLMAHSQAQEAAAGIASKEDFDSTCLARMADPSEIADTIVYLLGDKSTFVTGAAICVDGGWAC